MKCPNCGSTAQVRMECEPKLIDNDEILMEGLFCGCGYHFEVRYARNENGFWTVQSIIDNYKVKKG